MWRRIRSSKDCPYANAQCLFNIGVQAPAARTTHPDEKPGCGADMQKVVPGSRGVQPYSSGSHPSTRDQGNCLIKVVAPLRTGMLTLFTCPIVSIMSLKRDTRKSLFLGNTSLRETVTVVEEVREVHLRMY